MYFISLIARACAPATKTRWPGRPGFSGIGDHEVTVDIVEAARDHRRFGALAITHLALVRAPELGDRRVVHANARALHCLRHLLEESVMCAVGQNQKAFRSKDMNPDEKFVLWNDPQKEFFGKVALGEGIFPGEPWKFRRVHSAGTAVIFCRSGRNYGLGLVPRRRFPLHARGRRNVGKKHGVQLGDGG